ncbi:MAG: hypothetical protein ACK5NK_14980 [Niabella sp.]
MKVSILLLLILCLHLYSCGEKDITPDTKSCNTTQVGLFYPRMGSLCNTSQCNEYVAIWEQLFCEKNGLSEAFFNNHIQPYSTKITSSAAEEYFYVYYNVNVDWVLLTNMDSFVVKTNGHQYPHITSINIYI